MIMIEPGMMTRDIFAVAFKEPSLFKRVIQMTREGKDIWPSRPAALEWFSKRIPWNRWDPRVLHLFVVSLFYFIYSLLKLDVKQTFLFLFFTEIRSAGSAHRYISR